MTTFEVLGTATRTGPRTPGAAPRPPVRVRHDLAAGGLLDTEALAELAGLLPGHSIEHNLGAVPLVLPGGRAPQAELTPREIVRSLADNGCWMVLKNVEQDPRYAALLDACLDQVEPLLGGDEGRSVLREGFVFLSAPDAVTPTHIDPEHNVLLQVAGTKTMSIGRFRDDEERDLQAEQLACGEHRNLDAAAVDLEDFTLQPGDGVYVPVCAPHVVRNGPAPSVSLSITWRTRRTRRQAHASSLNARLRRRGMPLVDPHGPGPVLAAAAAAERGARLAGRLRRR